MNKKIIQLLIDKSYTLARLDPEKVKKIALSLSRFQLKLYIKALKKYESQKNVEVWTARQFTKQQEKALKEQFRGKRIKIILDPNLLVGIKVKEADIIYNLNLKSTLENLSSYIIRSFETK